MLGVWRALLVLLAQLPLAGGVPAELTGSVCAGDAHSCALTTAGQVSCWGRNGASGRLGLGSVAANVMLAGSYVSLGGSGVAVQISCGKLHTCALLQEGHVRCWGSGANGRLGLGDTRTVGTSAATLPSSAGDVVLDGSGIATQVVCGADHTCAVLQEGGVRCWGVGGKGALTYAAGGSVAGAPDALSPVAAVVGCRAIQLSAGNGFTCALCETGMLRCWGLGLDGAAATFQAPHPPPSFGGGTKVTMVSSGEEHTCVLLATGSIRCFGVGTGACVACTKEARLGLGAAGSVTAAAALDIGSGTGQAIAQVSCGMYHTCIVLDDNALRCFGYSGYGRLGYGGAPTSFGIALGDGSKPPPTAYWAAKGSGSPYADVMAGGAVVQVAAGSRHTCVVRQDKAVLCFGLGNDGRLGYGDERTRGDSSPPSRAGPVPLGGPAVAGTVASLGICLPGRGLLSDESACQACALAEYRNGFVVKRCTACPNGKWTDQMASTSCTVCVAGKTGDPTTAKTSVAHCIACVDGMWASEGLAACIPCREGKTGQPSRPRVTEAHCEKCAAGRDTVGLAGALACTDCTVGRSAEAGDRQCARCAPGKYQSLTKQPACLDCAKGREQPAIGQTACVACAAGKYAELVGRPTCTPFAVCGVGQQLSSSSVTNSGDCTECPVGRVKLAVAADTWDRRCTQQLGCPAGRYRTGHAATIIGVCTSCATGRAKELGATAPNAWSDQCIVLGDCPPGHERTGHWQASFGACTKCVAGRFKPLLGTYSVRCGKCGTGRSTGGVRGRVGCDDCALGRHAMFVGTGDCPGCPAGRYNWETKWASQCSPCQIGRSTNNETGYAMACKLCAVGKWSDAPAMPHCHYCSRGQHGKHGQRGPPRRAVEHCTQCVSGRAAPEPGLANCIVCPAGRHGGRFVANVTVPEDGSMWHCKECPVGTFSDAPGTSRCNTCGLGNYGARSLSAEQKISRGSGCARCAAGQYSDTPTDGACTDGPLLLALVLVRHALGLAALALCVRLERRRRSGLKGLWGCTRATAAVTPGADDMVSALNSEAKGDAEAAVVVTAEAVQAGCKASESHASYRVKLMRRLHVFLQWGHPRAMPRLKEDGGSNVGFMPRIEACVLLAQQMALVLQSRLRLPPIVQGLGAPLQIFLLHDIFAPQLADPLPSYTGFGSAPNPGDHELVGWLRFGFVIALAPTALRVCRWGGGATGNAKARERFETVVITRWLPAWNTKRSGIGTITKILALLVVPLAMIVYANATMPATKRWVGVLGAALLYPVSLTFLGLLFLRKLWRLSALLFGPERMRRKFWADIDFALGAGAGLLAVAGFAPGLVVVLQHLTPCYDHYGDRWIAAFSGRTAYFPAITLNGIAAVVVSLVVLPCFLRTVPHWARQTSCILCGMDPAGGASKLPGSEPFVRALRRQLVDPFRPSAAPTAKAVICLQNGMLALACCLPAASTVVGSSATVGCVYGGLCWRALVRPWRHDEEHEKAHAVRSSCPAQRVPRELDGAAQASIYAVVLISDFCDLGMPDVIGDMVLLVCAVASILLHVRCLELPRVARRVMQLVHREMVMQRIGDVRTANAAQWDDELRFLSDFQTSIVLERDRETPGGIFSQDQFLKLCVQNTQVRQFQLVDFTALLAGGTPTFALPADAGDVSAMAVASILLHVATCDVEELECTGAGVGIAGALALGAAIAHPAAKCAKLGFVTLHRARIPVRLLLGPDDIDSVGDDAQDDFDFVRSHLTDSCLAMISQLLLARVARGAGPLRILDISQNDVTDAGVAELVRSGAVHCVRYICLTDNAIGSAAYKCLGEELVRTPVGKTALRCLSVEAWTVHESSKRLRAVDANLREDDALLICGLLKHNTMVRTLDLSHNESLGRPSLNHIAEMLYANRTLTTLKLNVCGLVPSIRFVKVAIEENDMLVDLQFAKNKVCNEDANAIGVALRHNETMQRIIVHRRPIFVQQAKHAQVAEIGKLRGTNAIIVMQLRRRIYTGGSIMLNPSHGEPFAEGNALGTAIGATIEGPEIGSDDDLGNDVETLCLK